MPLPFADLVMAPPDIYPEAMRDGERDRFLVPGYRPIGSESTGLVYRPGVLEIDTSAHVAHFFDIGDYDRRRSRPGTIKVLSRIVAIALTIAVATLVFPPPSHASESDVVIHVAIALTALGVALICTPFLVSIGLAAWKDRERERAIPVDVPEWLIEWLAPMWDRVEKSISHAQSESARSRSSQAPDDAGEERPFSDAFWKSFAEGMAEDIFGELGGAAAGAGADAALDRKGMARERLANLIRRHSAWRIARLHERSSGRPLVRVEPDEWPAGMDFTNGRFLAGLQPGPGPEAGGGK